MEKSGAAPKRDFVDPEFTAAIESGDRKLALLALRKLLAIKVQVANTRDTASISKELRDVMDLLSEIEASENQGGGIGGLRERKRQRMEEIDRLLAGWQSGTEHSSKSERLQDKQLWRRGC